MKASLGALEAVLALALDSCFLLQDMVFAAGLATLESLFDVASRASERALIP